MNYLIAGAVFGVLYYSWRYAWWKPAVSYEHPRILMYHMVREHLPAAKFNSLRVTPDMFEKQVKYLREHGWTFFTMSELVAQKAALPPRSVAITFDDGYADNYVNALPILKKYDAKATLYLVLDRHDREWSSKRKAKNRSGELMHEPKLDDAQVREMIASGVFEIASHTVTHDNLGTIAAEAKEREIAGSKQAIEETFGIACPSFCYPFGLGTEEWKRVEAAGYTNATTTEKGISDIRTENPYLLKRITVSGKDGMTAFRLKLRTGKRGVKK